MDAQERLSREEARAPTLLGSMHVHRYELAAELCRGLRVADVGCGSGYGSEILARESAYVLGVDLDERTIATASEQLGEQGRLEFEVADARDFLRERLRDRFEAIVMLETLEHLADLEDVLTSLRRHADDGVRMVLSVPNSQMLDEDNPYHLLDFGFEEAKAAFAGFPDARLVYQFLAEGSLIQPASLDDRPGSLVLGERGELEYANQFIALVNFGDAASSPSAVMQLEASPLNQRYVLGLERANDELRRANARLARRWLGRADSAAAALVARVQRLEESLAQANARAEANARRPEDQRIIEDLDREVAKLNQAIAGMQSTRVWRFASGFWAVKRRLRRKPID